MKKLGGLLFTLAIVLVFIGCSSVSPNPSTTPASVVAGDKLPPANINWISPAKVNVSNFHLGATAEYPLTVHNGNKGKTQFIVEPRVADYTGSGYMKAPVDMLQDWVVVTDSSPILGALETRDILITIEMPDTLNDAQAQFWQFTDDGAAYYVALQTAALEVVKAWATKTIQDKYKNRPQDILPEMITELITPSAIEKELMKNADAPLLVYMLINKSVTLQKFQAEQAQNVALVTKFEEKGYVVKGDLRKNKWEFWVSVTQAPQAGNMGTKIETEICARWLVAMRQ